MCKDEEGDRKSIGLGRSKCLVKRSRGSEGRGVARTSGHGAQTVLKGEGRKREDCRWPPV